MSFRYRSRGCENIRYSCTCVLTRRRRHGVFAMFGIELPWCGLRVRTALEMELKADVYARQVLCRCVNTLPQFSPANFIPQLLSEGTGLKMHEARTVVGLPLKEAFKCVFRDTVSKDCLRGGIFSSMHHLISLSCVIGYNSSCQHCRSIQAVWVRVHLCPWNLHL